MSYAAQPPVAEPEHEYEQGAPPVSARPAAVSAAAALLWTMAVAGLIYAIGMVAVTPGTIGRFREATSGSEVAENFIAVVWLDSAVGAVIALLVVALFVVLGLGLRRGNRAAWGTTLGVCVLGVLGGCGSVAAIGGQQSGDAVPGSLGDALNDAYPGGWIGLNAAVAVAQVIAYLLVAFLLLLAPRGFFGGAARDNAGPAAPGGQWVPAGPSNSPGAPAGPWSPVGPSSGAWNPGVPPSGAWHPGGPPSGPWTPSGGSQGGAPGVHAPYGAVSPPSESGVTGSPWAAPQSPDHYSQSDQSPSEADQNSGHPPVQKPVRGPEDEFWSRPSD